MSQMSRQEERFLLVMERIAEIAEETDVPETFDDYFKKRPQNFCYS